MTRYIVGIDPGKTGALALVAPDGELVDICDMPIAGKQVVPTLLDDWFTDIAPIEPLVVLEAVHAMPRQGVASSFNFGVSYGVLLGVVAARRLRLETVTPARWKRDMRLTADKDEARRRACQRWPDDAWRFKRKKDDGRAEAALLAVWWATKGDG